MAPAAVREFAAAMDGTLDDLKALKVGGRDVVKSCLRCTSAETLMRVKQILGPYDKGHKMTSEEKIQTILPLLNQNLDFGAL